MRPLRYVAVGLLLAIITASCTTGEDPSASTPPGTGDTGASDRGGGESTITPPFDPIDLDVTLDDARRAEAVIPIEGGTLTATGADGTVYTLDIPADALLFETLVTMTPVANSSGLPFGGGESWAVQLAPDGLAFNAFVTLTITPEEPVPVEEQLFFGYEGAGTGLFLALPDVDSPELKIQLLHFSGYGATKGLLADIEPVRARLGGAVETRIQSAIAEHLAGERQRQLLGDGDDTDVFGSAEIEELMRRYREEVVAPRVAAAGESCAAGRLALETVLALERQAQLLGGEDRGLGEIPGLAGLMEIVGRVCLQEEYEMCRDEHIIHRLIPVWLGIERQAQLLGIASEDSPSALGEEARGLVDRCLRFDLEYESGARLGILIGWESEMRATVPIRLTGEGIDFTLTGTGTMEQLRLATWYNTAFNECSTAPSPGGGVFEVAELWYEVGYRGENDLVGHVTDFSLRYAPPLGSDSVSVSCPYADVFILGPSLHWMAVLFTRDVESFDGWMRETDGWTVVGGELFATVERTYSSDQAGDPATEALTFRLYHRPG